MASIAVSGYRKILAEGEITVGTVAVAIPFTPGSEAVLLLADSENTGVVYWGGASVTAETGFPLADTPAPAGNIIPVSLTAGVSVVGSDAGQVVRYKVLGN